MFVICTFTVNQNFSKILRTGALTEAFLLLNTSISVCSNYQMRKADDRIFTFTINQNVYKILNFVLSQLIMNNSKILRTCPLTGAFLLLNTGMSVKPNYHVRKVDARVFYI